jgi:hypothetical protein
MIRTNTPDRMARQSRGTRAVIIGPHDKAAHPDTIDFGRIEIEENDLS